MVAESLFLIKDSFENYSRFDDNDNKKTLDRRLIITNIGQITLGDRDTGKVTLEGDTAYRSVLLNTGKKKLYNKPRRTPNRESAN